MTTYSHPAASFKGKPTVPGDKSISHRSLMLAALAQGTSCIDGLLEGEDVLATAEALRKLGVSVVKSEDQWHVDGVGMGGFKPPQSTLDMGNAGTGSRLMMGVVATYDFDTTFTGDTSLCARPMQRIVTPLEQMGIAFTTQEDCRLPLTVHGNSRAKAISYTLPVASAQVKSAILLAGLNIDGKTRIIEPFATRDHTERMLSGMGAHITTETKVDGNHITLTGKPTLKPQSFVVPADPSSAAFLVVAALITPDADVTVANVCLNPTRTGLFTTLQDMGANITYINKRDVAGETVADIHVTSSKLTGVHVPADRAPSMIDEYPILSIAAATAKGNTVMQGLEELKVKESNRLQAIADGLMANGVVITLGSDSLTVKGGVIKGGGMVATHLDHRIAMSFLVMGMVAQQPVAVDDVTMIDTSFPGFITLMNHLGARIAYE